MDSFYQISAILTSGISLSLGLFSLVVFFYKGRENVHLIFAIMCLLVATFILLPPVGFILSDNPPYSAKVKFKRIFNLAFMALFPWFVALYTGYKKKVVPFLALISMLVCYVMMIYTAAGNSKPLWVGTAIVVMVIILAHGVYAGFRQYKTGDKRQATWLLVALGSFTLFSLSGAIMQLYNSHLTSAWDALFFPTNICPLGFIVIMSIQLQAKSNKQANLEKLLGLKEHRYQSLLKEIQLVIVNTDTEEKIRYINPYGLRLLNYKDESEVLTTCWSDHCLKAPVNTGNKSDTSRDGLTGFTTMNKSFFATKDGKQKMISWVSELVYDDEGVLVGKMFIGSDITEHQEALEQIRELKAELEKENLAPKEHPISPAINQDTIGKSRPFMYAIQKSRQVARTNASVLLLGETGVGKESFANLIQETSLRSNMPFVKVNCGALPAELIEDELFGHEKGAFTGAVNSRMGRFEKANGGTIFLDEIGELPLVLQPKLLRVLQNGEFERVGGHQTIKVDVRIIAATNNDLEKEVRENRFREDLFYRLNVFPITIPPLRKRSGDLVLLIQNFIERKSKEYGKNFQNISKADMNRLCDYEWPGNIRQLKNVIERAVISSEDETLRLDWFYEEVENNSPSTSTASLEEIESAYIVKVLQECRWKINGENGAAEKLVLHPNTLRSRMKKLNINVPWKQES